VNEIFRFLTLRPPAVGTPVTIAPSAGFTRALTGVSGEPDPGAARKALATRMLSSSRGLAELDDLIFGAQLLRFEQLLDTAEDPHRPELATMVQQVFDATATDVVNSESFTIDRERLSDNLLAAKLLSRDGAVPALRVEALLRLTDLLIKIAGDDAELEAAGAVAALLKRPTVLPAEVVVPDVRVPDRGAGQGSSQGPGQPAAGSPDGAAARRAALEERVAMLRVTARSLATARPTDFATGASTAAAHGNGFDGAQPPAGHNTQPPAGYGARNEVALAATRTGGRLRLRADAVARLSAVQQQALRDRGLDPTTTPVPVVLRSLNTELTVANEELARLSQGSGQQVLIGGSPYERDSLANPGAHAHVSDPTLGVPHTHGDLVPVGIGDLLVARQHIKRYEAGEVAHIENVLRGEFKKRVHERSRTTEETTIVEVETKRDEERDTQTTERFELQHEASTVQKEDSAFKFGLSVSGSYGPAVEVKATTDFALNTAKEESSKTATRYAKEVTDKASTKVSERRREEHILRTLEVFKETNEHGVDNTAGDGHVIGVYQWVDKVYEAQVFNYGKRLLFDFMVPEPGAFWLYANATGPKPGSELVRPKPFTLSPYELDEHNFVTYVKQYQVAGVKPPPAEYVTLAKTFEATVGHDEGGANKVLDLPIPDGYQAVSGWSFIAGSVWSDLDPWVGRISIGTDWYSATGTTPSDHEYVLNNEVASIPVTVHTYRMWQWTASVEVDCQRTDRALNAWRLETHTAIMQAYLKLERDYADRLAALQTQAANAIQGRNPMENRAIERTELKKLALSMFTGQHFDMFGSIRTGGYFYPEALLSEAELEGRYIRFFEQAFEWENMMYLFYPYFWGRKELWTNRALLPDADPQFAEFLRAGAARVVVPTRPGFEEAVVHFLDTGEIWEGAGTPTLTSKRYVSIIDEIKERDHAPGAEVAEGDPWEVRLPTTLVRLREDGSLPAWVKSPTGEWAPA
jgi:hypothetical protein